MPKTAKKRAAPKPAKERRSTKVRPEKPAPGTEREPTPPDEVPPTPTLTVDEIKLLALKLLRKYPSRKILRERKPEFADCDNHVPRGGGVPETAWESYIQTDAQRDGGRAYPDEIAQATYELLVDDGKIVLVDPGPDTEYYDWSTGALVTGEQVYRLATNPTAANVSPAMPTPKRPTESARSLTMKEIKLAIIEELRKVLSLAEWLKRCPGADASPEVADRFSRGVPRGGGIREHVFVERIQYAVRERSKHTEWAEAAHVELARDDLMDYGVVELVEPDNSTKYLDRDGRLVGGERAYRWVQKSAALDGMVLVSDVMDLRLPHHPNDRARLRRLYLDWLGDHTTEIEQEAQGRRRHVNINQAQSRIDEFLTACDEAANIVREGRNYQAMVIRVANETTPATKDAERLGQHGKA